MDGRANGSLLNCKDVKVLEWDFSNTVDVIGFTDDSFPSLPSAQAAAKIDTVTDGPIIGIFSNYAVRDETDHGHTIHSKGQLESFGLLLMIVLKPLVAPSVLSPTKAMSFHYTSGMASLTRKCLLPLIPTWRHNPMFS